MGRSRIEVALGAWIRDARSSLKRAMEDVTKSLTILDKHLLKNTYMVGDQVTIADIFVSCTIAEGTSTVFGSDFLQPCVNLRRCLEHSLKQPELSAVLGKSQFGAAVEKKEKAPMKAKPKKEAAPKEATAKKEIAGER